MYIYVEQNIFEMDSNHNHHQINVHFKFDFIICRTRLFKSGSGVSRGSSALDENRGCPQGYGERARGWVVHGLIDNMITWVHLDTITELVYQFSSITVSDLRTCIGCSCRDFPLRDALVNMISVGQALIRTTMYEYLWA